MIVPEIDQLDGLGIGGPAEPGAWGSPAPSLASTPGATSSNTPDDTTATSAPTPTTKQARLEPRILVDTGDGKGKSTAAFGMGLRGWAQGWSIGVFQFVKSGKWQVGEHKAYAALNRVHEQTGEGGPISWEIMGQGWTWLRATSDVDQAELARQGWAHIVELLERQAHDLYILDEFSYALANGWLPIDDVLHTLRNRPGAQHVVITGRRAPQALIDAADLVTEMTKIKHPFDQGKRGQAGIEW